MTSPNQTRCTIVMPEASVSAVNASLGLSIQSAGWRDADGHLYAATSFLMDAEITADNLSDLPVVVFGPDDLPLFSGPGGAARTLWHPRHTPAKPRRFVPL